MKLILSFFAVAFTALVSNIAQAEGGSYGAQPPSQAPGSAAPQGQQYQPDNTGRNRQDRGTMKPEAEDQSNNPADVDLTARIRRAVTDDSSLSVNAHNVKIITANGRVTLRGPVNSDAERRKVEALAKKAAGTRPVVNELEVRKP